MPTLFDPLALGGHILKNRIGMAPMTRARAPSDLPNEHTVLYYRQRASAGLIVTEGVPFSDNSIGFLFCPGICNDDQVAAWQNVTDAVHKDGGTIFMQLWHVGRMSHVSLQPGGNAPISSMDVQAIAPIGGAFARLEDGSVGFVPPSVPRALTTAEVEGVVADYVAGAERAIRAGCDGVEIHAAGGYLIEQFMNSTLNQRDDKYGGTIENRSRFLLEIVDGIGAAIGIEKLGVRLSPLYAGQGMAFDPEGEARLLYLADQFQQRGLGYVHLSDTSGDFEKRVPPEFRRAFRARYKGPLLLAGALTPARAAELVEAGEIDMAVFGQPFIANPDLVERIKGGHALAVPDRNTYYGGDHRGYTDYPFRETQAAE